MSLRTLINLRILLSVIIVIIIGGCIALLQARTSVEREVEASFNLAVNMIQSSSNKNQFDSSRHWEKIVAALQHSRHISVKIVDGEGHQSNFIKNTNKSDEATPPQWFISMVDAKQLIYEFEITASDGSIKHIRVVSDPGDEISEAWSESNAYFASIILLLLLIFLAINLVFHSMLKIVGQILSGLREVESGKYDKPLPYFNIKEFDSIAHEINSLATILAETQRKNQALARHTMHIQEQERQTMSRELHDEMGQSLTAIKAMSFAIKEPKTDIPFVTDSIIDICDHLAIVVRSMMRSLHPLSLSDLGLGATLTDLTQEWQRRHPVLEIDLHYNMELDSLDNAVAIHLFRIIQESLTNVVKHAKASFVSVSLMKIKLDNTDFIEVKIIDNGIGGDSHGEGFGVRSMRERVENMHGNFDFKSIKGSGVAITATIPLIH